MGSPPIETRLEETLGDYWLARVAAHTTDSYAGIALSKFPEDLRVYERLLWDFSPDVVIEIGAEHGASALWFRDRLATLASYGRIDKPLVISVDLDVRAAEHNLREVDPEMQDTIKLLEGDVRDPDLPDRVAELLPPDARPFVIEDSGHSYETTWAALEGFCRFVPQGGYFIVEDGCVDIEPMRLSADWPRGVLPALTDWLATPEGTPFESRRDLEMYGVSCHPRGFLQRTGAPRE